MSFCSSCGAENTTDARFCNKCGAKIGDASPPPVAPSSTNITLAGIGIRSQRQTNTVLAIGAVLFLALGAGIAMVMVRSGGDGQRASTTTAPPPSSDAIPTGVDVPESDFVMTSGARVVKRGGSAPPAGSRVAPDPHGDPTAPAATTVTPPETTAHPHHAHHAETTAAVTGTTADPIAPPSATTTASTTTTATGGGSAPPSSSVDWGAMQDTTAADGEDPDYQMQMYSTQVRRFIRQYLLPQATSCFEHASAASRDPVRGNVTIGFDIDARGHAQSASIDRNTTGIEGLGRCLQNNVSTWQLPPPPAGTAPIQMQMPFTR